MREIKLRLLPMILMLLSIGAMAQTTITIGNTSATTSTEKYPFNNPWDYSWSNNIYLASEIGQAGQITAVAFDVTSVTSGYYITNQKIYVRHTTATGYSSTTYPGISGYTLVYSGDITYTTTGWKTITFDTPFSYNGTDNLEFLFENRDGSYNNVGFPYYRYTSGQSTNRVRRDYNDVTFPSTCVYCGMFANLLNIRLTLSPACTTTLTVNPSTATICNGSSATLTAGGVSTYSWTPSTGLNTTTGTSVVASPTASATYTVYGTDASNCTQTKTVSVTVNPLPVITTNPASPSVCLGGSVTITASGAATYAWSPSTGLNVTTGATVVANPTVTTNYTITGTSSAGCISTKTITVTVNGLPNVSIAPPSPTICSGGSIGITASGASTYSWNPSTGLSASTGANVTANPTVTTNYTVTGTNASGCTNALPFTVTVNPLPNVLVSPASATICSGGNTSLTASGAATYAWAPSTGLSATTGAAVVASPTATITYTVTGTDANGCTKTETVTVTVNSLPTISISPASATICSGTSTTLTASGASTYVWSPSTALNTTTGATVIANPISTITYTVAGTGGNGCSSTKTVTVTVNTSPVVAVNPSSATVCNGSSVTLSASGAATYAWSPSTGLSATTGSTVISTPVSNITYTVTGTSANCSSFATASVNVATLDAGIASAVGTANTCNNSQVVLTLNASGGSVTIGSGTNTTEKYPFNGPWDYSWSNVIYLQSELGAAGTISALSFYVGNSPSNYTMDNQYIYIKHTSSSSFASSTYPGTSGYTQVFNGTITYNGTGWKTITLNTPFNYDGVNNLDILYENRDGSFVNVGFPVFRYTTGYPANRVRRDYRDTLFPSTCYACNAFPYVLNTVFTKSGGSFNGTFVKWQQSTNNLNWTDLPGGTTQTYTATVQNSAWYRAEVTGASCPAAYSVPAYYATSNNYYVNDNSSAGDVFCTAAGNSGNDGKDPSRPKTSVSAIISAYNLGPCDTVFIDKGSYTDDITISNYSDGGSSQGYTVFYGAGKDVTVLTAPASKNNVLLSTAKYLKVERMTLNSTQAAYPNAYLYRANRNVIAGSKLTHNSNTNISLFGDTTEAANNNQFLNNSIINSSTGGYGIYILGNSDSLTIDGDSISMTNATSQSAILATTVFDTAYISFPGYTAINNNVISAYSYGLRLFGAHFPISTYTVSGNKITMLSKTTADGAAIKLSGVGASSVDKSHFFNNRLIGGKNGIHMGSNVNYARIYNNYISGSDYGLYVASSSSNVEELYFNSFYNDISNLYFASYSFGYWKVKNNILFTTNSSASNACIDANAGSGATFVGCDYNLYYAPNGASIARYNNVNHATLASWKSVAHADETPLGDESSKGGDPLYSLVPVANLDISISSPALISATPILGITKDIYEATRAVIPAIGAHEGPLPMANAGSNNSVTSGDCTTIGGAPAASGLPPFTYSWSPANSLNSSTIANPIACPSVTTTYTLTVTDGAGRISISVVTLSVVQVTAYAVLRRTLDGNFYKTKNGKLYFTYDGEYNNGSLNYKVYSFDRTVVASNSGNNAINTTVKKYGDNRYVLDGRCGTCNVSEYYILEITNEKGEVVMLRFQMGSYYNPFPCQ